MTANTNTTSENNSSNDQSKNTSDNDESHSLAQLTPKQQAIIIATLEHPDEPAVSIATRVGTAQSYPSQVVNNHKDVLKTLQTQINPNNSVADVVERELSEQDIIDIVDRGLLGGVDTAINNRYPHRTGIQRSVLSAAPDNSLHRNSDSFGEQSDPDANTGCAAGSQTTLGSRKNNISNDSPDRAKPGNNKDDEELQQWYSALTEKQRAIVEAITENPDLTDTRTAKIASKKLPGDVSVSRAYVSIIRSEDADFLKGLRDYDQNSQRDSGQTVDSRSETRCKNNNQYRHRIGASKKKTHSQRASVPIEELKRVRNRIAFSASVIEEEYVLLQNTLNKDTGSIPVNTHAGTVAFAKQTLNEINELLEYERGDHNQERT